jgi:hypothetical protein
MRLVDEAENGLLFLLAGYGLPPGRLYEVAETG